MTRSRGEPIRGLRVGLGPVSTGRHAGAAADGRRDRSTTREHRVRPPAMPGRDALGLVDAHVTRRPAHRPGRPSCHWSSACAVRRNSANAPSGSRRSSSPSALGAAQVLAPELRAGCRARARRAPSPRPAGSRGSRSSSVVVEDRAGQLGVVGPRAAVHVVGADHHPHVVDDADLGVHVDRGALLVLEVADEHPIAAGALDDPRGPLTPDARRGSGDPPVAVGEAGHDHDDVELRVRTQRVGERACGALATRSTGPRGTRVAGLAATP